MGNKLNHKKSKYNGQIYEYYRWGGFYRFDWIPTSPTLSVSVQLYTFVNISAAVTYDTPPGNLTSIKGHKLAKHV